MSFWFRTRQLDMSLPAPTSSPALPSPDPLPEPVTVEIGEIPVLIKAAYCCGLIEWYGLFPDHSTCCRYPEHGSFDEALECSRRRVEAGFVVGEQP